MSTRGFVIWDFDGTLATRHGNWAGAVTEVVNAAGTAVTVDKLRPHLQTGFPWNTPDVARPPCPADEWWERLLPVFAGAIRAGAGLSDQDARRLAANVRATYLRTDAWEVFDDVVPALTSLRDRGWRHVMLANHVPELDTLVKTLGLREYFADIYTSARTGLEKPNPLAFEAVFKDHPEARAGWMIGDSFRADVQGAAAVGLRGILVRHTHAEARAQAPSLREVVRMFAA